MHIWGCHRNKTQRDLGQLWFICHSGAKEKEGVVVGDFKGQKGNSHEDEKANVWQINVCWAIFNKGTQGGL